MTTTRVDGAQVDGAAVQVTDDPALLDLMLADQAAADPRFQPTNYWAHWTPLVIAELRGGLHDFQRREGSVLASFGASDAPPTMLSSIAGVPAGGRDVVEQLVTTLNRALAANERALPYGLTVEDLLRTGYLVCENSALKSAQVVPISRLTVSSVGDPFGFRINGRFLTRSALAYYLRYAFVARHLDLANVDTVVELGSGAGKQTEVLKRLHPHLTIVLLDLAPQLYVADRYLHAALPRDVVSYRATRGADAPRLEHGKIHFLSNARIGDLEDLGRTLFWNAASFGEMEPNIVRQYGHDVSRFADWLFLHQCFAGKERGTEGGSGVLQPLKMPHYCEAFSGYDLLDRAPAHTGLGYLVEGPCHYDDTFWSRSADQRADQGG